MKHNHWTQVVGGIAVSFVMVLASQSMHIVHHHPAAPSILPRDEQQFDVNDVSYLWPVPRTKDDVAGLISVDGKLLDGTTSIWPRAVFDKVVQTAQAVTITNSAGRINRIDFDTNKAAFERPQNWKIVAMRVDPSAPGCDGKIIGVFGSIPQIRLVVQPVTVDDTGVVRIHDVSAHLVFSFAKGQEPPLGDGSPPKTIPDKDMFRTIVNDLKNLKAKAGVNTAGPLGLHPGLKAKTPGFSEEVASFLARHLSPERLTGLAFMGIETLEPWIFFSMRKQPDGTFAQTGHPTLEGNGVQMLTFKGGINVMPKPNTFNLVNKGVSTATLFEGDASTRLKMPVFADSPRPEQRDIPNIVANPRIAHFFNTDCISCHSESARRKEMNIVPGDDTFTYVRPNGISGVDVAVLPTHRWNVRNFGWFPLFSPPVPTASMRTANEAAESADFINREYLGQTP